MMSLLDIRRAILDSQPAAVNRLARSLLEAFRREAATGGDWKSVARHHLQAMAVGALLEERALGEERAVAFVAAVLAPIGRLAPLYRGTGEVKLFELADLVAGFGSERLDGGALRYAAENAREAALRALSRSREATAGSTHHAAGRDAKVALRRFFSVAAPALRLELAVEASRWIPSQGARLPLSTLARTPYAEMLPREMDLVRDLVSGYLEETWFRDGRYGNLFATIPEEFLASLEPAFGERSDNRLLRSIGSAILVPTLERLDLLDQDGEENGGAGTVVEIGRRIAEWTEGLLAAEMPSSMTQPRRTSLERLRAHHEAGVDALLLELRGRCAHASQSA